jgi:deoxyribodipyrimidine photo-lyase
MKTQAPILVWFRHDFRISDNPALFFAASQNRSVIPVFIWSDHETSLGAASRWWLSNSILAFRQQLRAFGSDLALRKGKPKDVFRQLLSETKATSIFFNRRFEPELWRQDQEFQSHFEDRLDIQSFPGNYLFEPGKISNKGQKPYQVFSAFYRAALKYADEEGPRTVLAPESLLAPRVWPKSDTILELREALAMKWAKKFEGHWKVGENAAEEMWNKFCATQLLTYSHDRNFPSIAGTSCLSPYLHFGQISPRKMFYDLQSSREESRVEFLRQLI